MSLSVRDVSFSYGQREVIKDISFDLADGEVLGLLGPNGTGKTTLLKCIMDLVKNKGLATVDGVKLKDLDLKQRAKYVAYVPQYINLVFPISVFDYIKIGSKTRGEKSKKEIEDLTLKLINDFHLQEFALKDMNQLSGGEIQRVMIASAMAQEPRVIILDEPTASLDMRHQRLTMDILTDIAKKQNVSVLLSIHDINLAARYCDRFLVLKEGQIYALGNSDQVITEDIISKTYLSPVEIINHKGKKIITMA